MKLIYYTSCIAKFHVIGKEGMSETYTPSLCWWRQALWCAGRHPVCPIACRLWLQVYNCCTSYTGL